MRPSVGFDSIYQKLALKAWSDSSSLEKNMFMFVKARHHKSTIEYRKNTAQKNMKQYQDLKISKSAGLFTCCHPLWLVRQLNILYA